MHTPKQSHLARFFYFVFFTRWFSWRALERKIMAWLQLLLHIPLALPGQHMGLSHLGTPNVPIPNPPSLPWDPKPALNERQTTLAS